MTAQLPPAMQALKDRKVIDHFDGRHRFLSNFYPCFGNLTVEHLFQAAKCEPDNEDARKEILAALTPGKAKRLGRRVTLPADWETRKIEVMKHLLLRKFQEPQLCQWLLDTGEAFLVEGNPWHDNEWGACSCTQCRRLPRKNLLGKMLMSLRKEIRNELAVSGGEETKEEVVS